MAQTRHTPSGASLEEAATVLFCPIDNAYRLLDPAGGAVYRKIQLYGAGKTAFVAGDGLLVVELSGVKVGVMVCFDVGFSELRAEGF